MLWAYGKKLTPSQEALDNQGGYAKDSRNPYEIRESEDRVKPADVRPEKVVYQPDGGWVPMPVYLMEIKEGLKPAAPDMAECPRVSQVAKAKYDRVSELT